MMKYIALLFVAVAVCLLYPQSVAGYSLQQECKCSCEPEIKEGARKENKQTFEAVPNCKCEGHDQRQNCFIKKIEYKWSTSPADQEIVKITGGSTGSSCSVNILQSGSFVLVLTVKATCSDGSTCSKTVSKPIDVKKQCECSPPTGIESTGGQGGAPPSGSFGESGFSVVLSRKNPCKTLNCQCEAEITYSWSYVSGKGSAEIEVGKADKPHTILEKKSRSGKGVVKVKVTIKCASGDGKCLPGECSKELEIPVKWS